MGKGILAILLSLSVLMTSSDFVKAAEFSSEEINVDLDVEAVTNKFDVDIFSEESEPPNEVTEEEIQISFEEVNVVLDFINTLPTIEEIDEWNEEEKKRFYSKTQEIYEIYLSLDEKQKVQLNRVEEKIYAIRDYFNDIPVTGDEEEAFTDSNSEVFFSAGEELDLFSDDSQVWDGSVANGYAGGDGTLVQPYVISNAEELAFFAKKVNGGETYAGKYFVLSNDIYLNDISDYESWSTVSEPDNKWDGVTEFFGSFDGQNHVIYGLYMNGTGFDGVGFFTYRFGDGTNYIPGEVVIKNLNFENAYIHGEYDGGIIFWGGRQEE